MKITSIKLSTILKFNSYNLNLSKYLSSYFKNAANLQVKTLYHLVTPSP
jgi:hypothetical protein